MNFAEIIKPITADFAALDQEIRSSLESKVPLIKQIGEYIISSGGKRLRPILSLLMARAWGYIGDDHIKIAAVVEFLHTSTLLHDDVIDNSHLRRKKPTANSRWGNAAPVLVGDYLLSRAFQIITGVGQLRLLECLSDATIVIAEGEVLQLVHVGDVTLSEAQYLEIIHYKTAKMFETAAELGSLLGNASPEGLEASRKYALGLGLAFQLVDDALDYMGNKETMGKNVGDDLMEGKMTLPLIHAYQNQPEKIQRQIKKWVELARKQTLTEKQLQDILSLVRDSNSIEYTLQQAENATEGAKEALVHVPESEFKHCLHQLADLSLTRQY